MSLQKSIGKHIELLRDIAAMEILRDHPENHSQFFKFLTYQINGDAFAEPLVAVLDVDNKHDIEAELREFLTDTHADEYCVSYDAWGLARSFPELPANFGDHPARIEYVMVVAGNSSFTLQCVLNVVRDAQDRIVELGGDGIGKYSPAGLFHGLLEPARPVTIN